MNCLFNDYEDFSEHSKIDHKNLALNLILTCSLIELFVKLHEYFINFNRDKKDKARLPVPGFLRSKARQQVRIMESCKGFNVDRKDPTLKLYLETFKVELKRGFKNLTKRDNFKNRDQKPDKISQIFFIFKDLYTLPILNEKILKKAVEAIRYICETINDELFLFIKSKKKEGYTKIIFKINNMYKTNFKNRLNY